MLRTSFSKLALAVGLVAVATQAARANFFIDVQNATTGNGNNAYLGVVDASHETFTLNVYALITDPSPSTSVDQYKTLAASFLVASSALKGDVSFGTWSPVAGASGAVTGTTFTTPFGALGLGGTGATDNSTARWWYAVPTNNPLTGASAGTNATIYTPPAVGSPPAGSEYFLGTVTVTFTGYSLPGTTTSAAFQSFTPTKYGVAGKSDQWIDNTGTYTNAFGSASNIGNGANLITYSASGAGLNFVFTSLVTGGSNAASLNAALGITGPTTLLGGGTTALAGAVSNNGANPANPLNWSTTPPGIVSLSSTGANGLLSGGSTQFTGSVLANPNGFGPWSVNVTFSGTDATAGTAAIGSPSVKNLAFAIIGKGTTGTGDGNGIPGATYGNFMTTQGSLAGGASLAGLTTTLGTGASSFGIGKTTATILAGTLGSSSTGISETWRSRSSNETPLGAKNAGGAPLHLPLYGDVVNLNGISGGTANSYVLQMSYDPAELGGVSSANAAASGGFLFLGYRSADGVWKNAASTGGTTNDGNTQTGPNAVANFQGSYAAFTAGPGNGFSLVQTLGSWGVDTAADTVWGVLDHDAEFAPVPEPGTIALLVGGIAALGFAYRRRKALKA